MYILFSNLRAGEHTAMYGEIRGEDRNKFFYPNLEYAQRYLKGLKLWIYSFLLNFLHNLSFLFFSPRKRKDAIILLKRTDFVKHE